MSDLSTVPAPKDLVVIARVANPSQTLDTALDWARVPLDWRRQYFAREPHLLDVVSLEAPLEALIALPPEGSSSQAPHVAVSLGLTSLDAARIYASDVGAEMIEVAPGVFSVTVSSWTCRAAASVGPTPARLVCSATEEELEPLLPYAIRGLPSQPLANADVVVQVFAEPLKARYRAELQQVRMLVPLLLSDLRLGQPQVDQMVTESAHSVLEEAQAFVAELEELHVQGWLRRDSETLELAISAVLDGERSWTHKVLVATQARASGVPDMFWKLPAQSERASWMSSLPADDCRRVRTSLLKLLDALLAAGHMNELTRARAKSVLSKVLTPEVTRVSASGTSPPHGVTRLDQVAARLGWTVTGIQDDGSGLTAALKDLGQLLTEPALKQALVAIPHESMARLAAALPQLVIRPAQQLGSLAIEGVLTLPPAWVEALGWHLGIDDELPSFDALSMTIMVQPGSPTWVVTASSKDEARSLMETILKGELETIRSRSDVGQLEATDSFAGGFTTLESIASMGLTPWARPLLASTPRRGRSPVAWRAGVESGTRARATLHLGLPQAAFQDAIHLAIHHQLNDAGR